MIPTNFAYKEIDWNYRVYLIADTHLFHDNLVTRGIRPKNFTQMIIENWLETVTDGDYVFVVGDFTFNPKKTLEILPQLKGKKYLIKGNHDHIRSQKLLRMFDFVFDALYLRYRYNRLKTYNFLLYHYPLTREQLMSLGLPIHVLLCGHSHNNEPFIDRSVPLVNLSAEHLGYRLIEIRDLIKVLKKERIIS